MGRNALGELEHLVLLATVRLGEGAYGAAVIEEIEEQSGRELSHAATYIALQRLERKGLLTGRDDRSAEGRGGRPRRYFKVTEAGLERLRESAKALFGMWRGVDPALRGEVDG
ncbi:MAG TPA: helix-turn-helix transcriptional regulator [Thermoanaerobaculia bacterium]|nr:helix-turn-helix transcriptional regulator [Thermoanaerobaculia bacterium]